MLDRTSHWAVAVRREQHQSFRKTGLSSPPGFPSLSHWGTWDSKARKCDLILWVTLQC